MSATSISGELTAPCEPVLLEDTNKNHYTELFPLNAEVEEARKDVVERSNDLLQAIREATSRLTNPPAAPLFGGRVYEQQVAYYLESKARGENTSSIEPRKIVDLVWKAVGGGSGSQYAQTYFDGENAQSVDTYVGALVTWSQDKHLRALIAAKINSIKALNQKREKLSAELSKLIQKTRLKGTCDFTKP